MRGLIILIFTVALLAAALWPYAKIFSRAGYSPWMCVLMVVPLVNLITLWVFAYGNWPALSGERSR